MKLINIKPYKVKVTQGIDQNGELITKETDYNLKESIKAMLVQNKNEGIDFDELEIRMKIVKKVNECDSNDLILEDAEYEKVLSVFKSVKGLSQDDYEFGLRIKNATVYALPKKTKVPDESYVGTTLTEDFDKAMKSDKLFDIEGNGINIAPEDVSEVQKAIQQSNKKKFHK